jgi:predicted DNA-binding protein with PD1-like motif
MLHINQHNDTYTFNAVPGEDIVTALATFATEHDVSAAHITGLGACKAVELAYYNLATKEYERTLIEEDLEICSLAGNIGRKENGEVVVHLHGVFARRDLSTLGGHIFSCVVSGAGELHVHTMPGTINRAHDEATGLTLMCPAHNHES